ncbi:AhpC/TSA family protein [Nostoc sp. LEGE 06077]|uniref:peroxiredoxin-like family protein n=1 Tax=Nostoc sp. LEGE 06077 TaxID=915325 RepID=UPI0018804D36|nr:peroxiredoxin-like family protein [Nostoc sp. LEGE 06077]MBE9210484.1 AhpC/TSA family protein [Nostoc sp. LEGE 06077]
MNTQTLANSPDIYSILSQTQRLRVSDGEVKPVLDGCSNTAKLLVLIWSQLGDFDNLEYAWWLRKEREEIEASGITIRAIGIGDRNSGVKFCEYTGFPQECLFVDTKAEIHAALGLYRGLSIQVPILSTSQTAWLNLMLMCAGIGSPGTLKEVFRGYTGDKQAPQLIADEEVVKDTLLPPIKGSFFKAAGGQGFQRPFELATLRLRNMIEVLSNWNIYVPDSSYLTQRGGTFLFDSQGKLIYEHRDRCILGFAENMTYPLSFLYK